MTTCSSVSVKTGSRLIVIGAPRAPASPPWSVPVSLPRLREDALTPPTPGAPPPCRPTTEESDDPFIALAAALCSASPSGKPVAPLEVDWPTSSFADRGRARCFRRSGALAIPLEHCAELPAPSRPVRGAVPASTTMRSSSSCSTAPSACPGSAPCATLRADFYEQASCLPAAGVTSDRAGNFTLAPPAPEALAVMGSAARPGALASTCLTSCLAALINGCWVQPAGTAAGRLRAARSFGRPAVATRI